MVSPSARRQGVKRLCEEHGFSERRACSTVGLSRSSARYTPRRKPDEAELTATIRAKASSHKRYGCHRVWRLLRREGSVINEKRVHRVWKAEGLQLPRRRPRRQRRGQSTGTIRRAVKPDQVWTYDFLEDRTEKGGKLRILTVLDEYTRECLAIRVEKSICSAKVIDTLEWLFLTRAAPEHIRSDNGPEFVAKAVQDWLRAHGTRTIFIEPGSPWENPYIESFNRSLRDECLNMEIFSNEQEAGYVAEIWREEYNDYRPHSSLGDLTPKAFAETPVPRILVSSHLPTVWSARRSSALTRPE